MSVTIHRCDDECVCPLDGKPLIYWPAGNQHACQDSDCTNAHGVALPSPLYHRPARSSPADGD